MKNLHLRLIIVAATPMTIPSRFMKTGKDLSIAPVNFTSRN